MFFILQNLVSRISLHFLQEHMVMCPSLLPMKEHHQRIVKISSSYHGADGYPDNVVTEAKANNDESSTYW